MSNKNYPHLDDTEFPDLPTVNVYKYQNDYDYTQYQDTVKIKLLNVPWCGDYDNAVFFDTKEQRDKWFEDQKGLVKELSTMFRLYSDGTLKVDIPIDECMRYNYAAIDYGKLPNQDALSGNHIMYYFVTDMIQQSVNTTQLSLAVDYWTCYIYDMGITYVNLLRGHAPMVATSVDRYLSNPLDESEYLLADDVSFGSLQRAAHTENIVFNAYSNSALEDITIGFQTNASMQKAWTDGDGKAIIPTAGFESSQAFSSVDPFILDNITYWEEFRENVMEQCPQFFETVKGMFVIPKKLVTYYEESDFTFCGIPCHFLASHSDIEQGTFKLTKEKFGFSSDFEDIAKLYTSPYSAIEVNDFKGGKTLLKVEDTTGDLRVHTLMCDMYPFLNVEAYMLGIGGTGSASVTFQNNFTHTMRIGGRYYDFGTKWSIPVFSVQLEAQKNWELNGKIDADNYVNNTKISADTNKECINNNNEATWLNFGKTKEWTESRNKLTCDFMDYSTSQATGNIDSSAGEEGKLSADMRADIKYMRAMTAIEQDYAAGSAVNNAVTTIAGAAISIAAAESTGGLSLVPTAAHAAGGAHAANITAGAALSGSKVATAANAGVSLFGTAAGYSTFLTKNSESLESSIVLALDKTQNAIAYAKNMNTHTQDYNTDIMWGELGMSEDITKRNVDTSDGNASIVNTKEKEIAENNYNADYRQTLLTNPPSFGQLTGTPDIIDKPFGLSFNVVTQSKAAIRQAAEQFMRYGYMLNLQWKVESFNVMPKFSYWQCDTVYCNDNGVYEGAQEMIKSILGKGITVWRKPEDIGRTSIYDNR